MNHRRGTYISTSTIMVKIKSSTLHGVSIEHGLRDGSERRSSMFVSSNSYHLLANNDNLDPLNKLTGRVESSNNNSFDDSSSNESTDDNSSDESLNRSSDDEYNETKGTDKLNDLFNNVRKSLPIDEPLEKKQRHVILTKTKYPHAILRYFDNSVLKYPQQVLISGYRLDGAQLALTKLIETKAFSESRSEPSSEPSSEPNSEPSSDRTKEPMYVVNVAYELDPTGKKKNKTGDTQLFMTGTIETGETPSTTTISELREEVKMEPIKRCCVKLLHEQYVSKNQMIYWYGCSVKHLKPAINTNKRRDTFPKRKDKVVCILYGTLGEVMDFLKRIPIHSEKNDENIDGLVCMKMSDVIKIEHITRSAIEYNNPYSKFYWKSNRTHELAFIGSYFPVGLSGTI